MHVWKNSSIPVAALSIGALLLTGCGNDAEGEANGFPERDLTLVAAGGPGGGLDTATRQLSDAMENIDVDAEITVQNDGEGNGNSARATVANGSDDGHSVVVESNRVILNPLMGTTDIQLDDFTPLAQLTIDELVWAVPADSDYEEAQDVIDAVDDDPESVTFGVGTTPSNDQLNILLPLQESGFSDIRNLNIVNFLDGGSLNTELLGGRVDVASTGLAEAMSLVESGDIRLLAVSGQEAPDEDSPAAGVPTWQDLGIDVELEHWRGVFGPADMPEDAVEWWVNTIEEATSTDSYQETVTNVGLSSSFVPSDEFHDEIVEDLETMEPVFTDLGMTGE